MLPPNKLAALAAGTVALLVATSLDAQTHDVLNDFEPSGQFQLLVEGEVVDATVAMSQKAAALLVLSDALETPLVIFAGSKRVDAIPEPAVLGSEESIDLSADVERTYLGDFTQDGREIVLPADLGRIVPKPPLLGARKLGDLLEHSPGYRKAMRDYRIDPAKAGVLADLAKPAKVRIVFGSWCSHCKHYLPHALKLEDTLRGSKLEFDYYGIDYPPEGWEDAEVKALGVTGLPTAIVYRDGEEVGRFTGAKGFEQIEETLVDILD